MRNPENVSHPQGVIRKIFEYPDFPEQSPGYAYKIDGKHSLSLNRIIYPEGLRYNLTWSPQTPSAPLLAHAGATFVALLKSQGFSARDIQVFIEHTRAGDPDQKRYPLDILAGRNPEHFSLHLAMAEFPSGFVEISLETPKLHMSYQRGYTASEQYTPPIFGIFGRDPIPAQDVLRLWQATTRRRLSEPNFSELAQYLGDDIKRIVMTDEFE